MEMNSQLHTLAALTPGKRAPGTHWIGEWMDHKAGLEEMMKRENLLTALSENRTTVVQPVA
jgi:hypothetical protein